MEESTDEEKHEKGPHEWVLQTAGVELMKMSHKGFFRSVPHQELQFLS